MKINYPPVPPGPISVNFAHMVIGEAYRLINDGEGNPIPEHNQPYMVRMRCGSSTVLVNLSSDSVFADVDVITNFRFVRAELIITPGKK